MILMYCPYFLYLRSAYDVKQFFPKYTITCAMYLCYWKTTAPERSA